MLWRLSVFDLKSQQNDPCYHSDKSSRFLCSDQEGYLTLSSSTERYLKQTRDARTIHMILNSYFEVIMKACSGSCRAECSSIGLRRLDVLFDCHCNNVYTTMRLVKPCRHYHG